MNPRQIAIHEWPNGCELIDEKNGLGIVIRMPEDAADIIESLQRYLASFNPAYLTAELQERILTNQP
jgi:hypothetical protein